MRVSGRIRSTIAIVLFAECNMARFSTPKTSLVSSMRDLWYIFLAENRNGVWACHYDPHLRASIVYHSSVLFGDLGKDFTNVGIARYVHINAD